MSRILKIDPFSPDDSLLREAAYIVKKSGVIIYPTETVYGIGALYSDEQALRRVFSIKKRDTANPVLLLIQDIDDLKKLAVGASDKARKLAQKYWPGPLTLLFHAAPGLSPLLTGPDNKVGCRISSNPVTQRLIGYIGQPVTSTSTNISGDLNISNINCLSSFLQNMVDIVIDAGDLGENLPSTVLDTTEEPFIIVREGSILPDF